MMPAWLVMSLWPISSHLSPHGKEVLELDHCHTNILFTARTISYQSEDPLRGS